MRTSQASFPCCLRSRVGSCVTVRDGFSTTNGRSKTAGPPQIRVEEAEAAAACGLLLPVTRGLATGMKAAEEATANNKVIANRQSRTEEIMITI